QYGFVPLRVYFEYCALTVSTPKGCGAIQVPCVITDQSCLRIRPIDPRESMQHRKLARGSHLENNARVGSTTLRSRAVKISCPVPRQTCVRDVSTVSRKRPSQQTTRTSR